MKSAAIGTAAVSPRTIDVPPMSIRASVTPQTVNDEDRTVELVITTNAPVERYDWATGKRYLEVLSMDPAHIRMDRLQGGVSLLDSHSSWSVSDVLGATVPDSARVMKNELRVKARFSRREAVEPIWQDVRDGIIKHVSIGYRIYKFEEATPKGNALPVRTATDWEPYEASMVPIPADAGAGTRGVRPADTNSCDVVSKENAMLEERSETIVEKDQLRSEAPAPAPAPETNERDLGAEQERERVQGIRQACKAGRMTRTFEDGLIAQGVTLVEAQRRVFEELAKRDVDAPRPGTRGPQVEVVGDDPLVHERAGIENAILHRAAPDLFKLEERGQKYRGMRLLDCARAFLSARGIRTTNLSPMELASVALGFRGGFHTTSDFANLLADLPGKILRKAYEEAPQTFGPIVRRMTLADFKAARLLQLGEAPALEEVLEHGEFKRGTIGESKEQVQLKTYGRVFGITRTALINDDTDAFSRVPLAFGRQARNLESDLVWEQITSNPTMGDTVALFDAAHANLSGTSDAIAIASIGAGRTAMRKQTGIDGSSLLNISPKFLIVPAAKETLADQFVSTNLVASQSSAVNPFAGRLTVIAEPRLDASSGVSWYLAADPAQIDTIVLATLEGEGGPMVDSRVGFDVDGVEIKVRHDVAAKVVDFRGFFKNPGA